MLFKNKMSVFASWLSVAVLTLLSTATATAQLDVSGDGVDDVLVRDPHAPGAGATDGVVSLLSGADATVIAEFVAPVQDGGFGMNAMQLADYTGDGVAEIGIAAPFAFLDSNRPGRINIYDGVTHQLLHSLVGDNNTHLTWAFQPTFDFDRDEVDDIIVAALELQPNDELTEVWRIFSGATGKLLIRGDNLVDGWQRYAMPAEFASRPMPTTDINRDGVVNLSDTLDVLVAVSHARWARGAG